MAEIIVNQKHHEFSDRIIDPYVNRLAELTQPLNDLFVLMDKTFFLLTSGFEGPAITKNQDTWDVFHFLFTRGMKTYRSIRCLLYTGCEQDALALLRNLIETLLTTKYIAISDTAGRAQRFRDFATVEKYRHMNGYRSSGLPDFEKLFPAIDVSNLDKDIKTYEAKYGIKYSTGLTWNKMNTYEMATVDGVDMLHDFLQAYGTYSMVTHSSYQGRHSYRTTSPSGEIMISWAPSFNQPANAGLLASGYVTKLAKICIDIMGISALSDLMLEVDFNIAGRMESAGYQAGAIKVKIQPGTWAILKRDSETGQIISG